MARDTTPTPGDDRGQSYTLEGIAAAILVLSGVIFAIQATAVTPLSVSTASQHVENQERALAATALDQALQNGTLREAVLYWNPTNRTFVNASGDGYVGRTPATRFGKLLKRVFNDRQIAVNVYISYSTKTGAKRRAFIYQGTPSANAVSAGVKLVLMDRDHLSGPHAAWTLNATNATPSFYAPDLVANGSVYNVLEVHIVAWRM